MTVQLKILFRRHCFAYVIMSIDLLILSGCSSFTSISINDTSSLGHKVFQAVSPKVQPEKNHNQAALLALTSNDSGDPRRMVEFDAILFMATELDQEDIGFNFLKLIAVNFNYFDSNRTRGAVHAANARRHAYELLHAWRFFSASGFYSVNSANVADEPVVVLADQSEDMPTTFLKVSVVETVINLNQNLILSGLGQCESHNGVSGVPYLMDPVLKYFFPTKLAMVSDSSVIILLTPQDSVFANAQYQKSLSEYINAGRSFTKATRGTREDMQRFFERYPNRQDQKSNCFASCFFMLEDSELYCTLSLQELTSEDVLPSWVPKRKQGLILTKERRMVKNSYFINRFLITIALLSIIGAALTACKEKPEIIEQIRTLKTITVSEQATGKTRKFSGIVSATDSANLSFEVSGRVETVLVDIGDRVEKGQVLAVLDKEPYLLDVDAAEAEYAAAEAGVVNAKEDFDRQERVYSQGAGAKSKLDKAKYNLEAARSQLNFQKAKVNLAKRNLSKTTLTSPYDGYIALRSVDPHEEIQVGQQVFAIDAKGALEVELAVPETTINRIHIGTRSTVRFPTLPGHTVKGLISYIGSAAVQSNAFPVKVGLVGSMANINPGMTAEVALALADDNQIAGFKVPIQAILPAKGVGQGYAFVYNPETATVKKTQIQVLGTEQNMMIVTEGLSSGDVIAVAGVSFLADGMKVRLMKH